MNNYRKTLLNRFIAQEKTARWTVDSFQVTTLIELLDLATRNLVIQYRNSVCVLMLVEEDSLVIKSADGLDIDMVEHRRIPIGKSFSGRLVKRGGPKLFNDVYKDIKAISDNMEPYYCGSLISVPLVFNRNVIGLLNIYRPPSFEPFTFDDFNIIMTYCSQTAFAIESQRLVDKRTEQLKETQETLMRLNKQLHQDIEARKKAEARSHDLLKELTNSNLELEQFAYIASHDLQEPLRMVASYMQLIEKRYKSKLDEEAHEFIGYAVDGAKRMQGLINDLLKYSRVGTKGNTFKQTDCEEVYKRAIKNLEIAISENNADIVHNNLPQVIADENQLVQCFQNIIANALKFCKDKTPRVHISARQDGNEWVFEFRDNGIGIAPEYQNRVFQIFQRLHNRDEYNGSGIGLAICKRIVERHGGKIWIESETNKGTTFWFTLPMQQKCLIKSAV